MPDTDTQAKTRLLAGFIDFFSLETLSQHLVDKDLGCLVSLCGGEKTPPFILSFLESVATENAYGDLMRKLIEHESTNADALLSIARHCGSTYRRIMVSSHPNACCRSLEVLYNEIMAEEDYSLITSVLSIAKHANCSSALLHRIFADHNQGVLTIALAEHRNADQALLEMILALPDNHVFEDINKPWTSDYSIDYSHKRTYIDRKTMVEEKAKKQSIVCLIAKNSATPLCLLQDIYATYEFARVSVAQNPSCDMASAFEWLHAYEHEEETVSLLLKCLWMRLKSTDEWRPSLFSSENSLFILYRFGYNLHELYKIRKIQSFVKLLIGTRHKEEVALLDHSMDLCLGAISGLQGLFTKGGKLDRFGYLQFLAAINSAGIDGNAFDVPSQTLMFAKSVIGLDGLMGVAVAQSFDNAKDTFRFIEYLVNENGPEYEDYVKKQTTLIGRWLAKNNFDYGHLFHDYLGNKAKRDTVSTRVSQTLYQQIFEVSAQALNDHLEHKRMNLRVVWPTSTNQLRHIGRAQRHCVGGQYYADNCQRGSNIIFATKVDGKLSQGITFQFETGTNRLLQAEGFARRSPNDFEIAQGKEFFDWILSHKANGIQKWPHLAVAS